MRLEFMVRGSAGFVNVTIEPNVDPAAVGCQPWARGFPICTATIAYEGRGYDAMIGWIQMVRSTDGRTEGRDFDIDPYEPLGQQAHPFCWFGTTPTLFGAPYRRSPSDMAWVAESYLAFISAPQEVSALLGFTWGFVVDRGVVEVTPTLRLSADDWDGRLAMLRAEYPRWTFASGYYAG